MTLVLLYVERTPSICPNRRTVFPNGRILSRGVDGGRTWAYHDISVKHLFYSFNEYKEVNIFVRGMIYDLGLKTKFIPYDIRERKYGESKFNFLSLSKMALSAIVSFSTRPLKFVFCIGAFISVISMILALIMAIQLIFQIKLLSPSVAPFEVWETFATGVEILCIGIIGEYISQTLAEAKKRPRYVIDEELI